MNRRMNGSRVLPAFIRAYLTQVEEGALPQRCDGFCFRTTGLLFFQNLRQPRLKVIMLLVRAAFDVNFADADRSWHVP